MKKWIIIALAAIPLILIALVATVIALVVINCRDIPPPDVSDLVVDQPEIPDASNAYTYLEAAGQALEVDDAEKLKQMATGKWWDDAYASNLLGRNVLAMEKFMRAAACEGYRMPDPSNWRNMKIIPTNLTEVAKCVKVKIVYEQRRGRYHDAVCTCSALLGVGRLSENNADNIIGVLIGMSIRSVAEGSARELAMERNVSDRDLASLLDAVWRPHTDNAGLLRAFKGEYWFHARFIEDTMKRTVVSNEAGLYRQVARNLVLDVNRTKAIMATDVRHAIRQLSLPYSDLQPACTNMIVQGLLFGWLGPNNVGKTLASAFPVSADTTVRMRYKMTARLSATRLVLACKLYERRHGQLPDTLASLVPDYIEAVPQDPFDGKPFRYSKEKGIVYAVGEDLKDDGGMTNSQRDIVIELGASQR